MATARVAVVVSLLLLPGGPASAAVNEWESIPDATFENLELSRDATPAELYEAVAKRYRKELTKGKFADLWEPIPIDQYFAPTLFYEPPNLDLDVSRTQCVQCHEGVTHGWVQSWRKSVHADLDAIRELPESDVRAYKKDIIEQVEQNLRSQDLLAAGEPLEQVSCIDCHMGVGRNAGNHAEDLRMPDRAVCGTCHVRQFVQAESERDTQDWPQDQWPDGHPSHAVDYMANVELATWATLPQREVAAGCTNCHVNQTKCDTCHTRHQFATAEARKPQACATCHNGVDHNEFEQYMTSKHGTVYQTLGRDQWNWDARLADATTKGGYTAPTCAYCHFEYKGEFTHNVTRKVRWGFLPFKSIAENLDHPWFEQRKLAWQGTCSNCHSPRFAETYLDFMDKGIKQGIQIVEETREVVESLYDDGLLVGQQTNRPPMPEPVAEGPGQFSSLFMSRGNNPTMVDRIFTEMWEQDVARLMKGYEHVNPGGWTYTGGWSDLVKHKTFILEQDTRLRERARLEARVARLEGSADAAFDPREGTRPGLLTAARDNPRAVGAGLGLLGGALVLGGLVSLRRRGGNRRRDGTR